MSYRIVKDDVANFDEIKSILIKYFEEGLWISGNYTGLLG
jgi:hypothetical protein